MSNALFQRKLTTIEAERLQQIAALKEQKIYSHVDIAGYKLERWIFGVAGIVIGAFGLFLVLLLTNHLQ